MLARGIHSYHRPSRIEEAMDLAARGALPLAGGTRLLTTPHDVPNVLDLSALGLSGIAMEDGDLVLGAMTTLQDTLDSAASQGGTGGLLPAACRAQSPSRMVRAMATLGGESVHGAHDSEVVAALLALNAVYVIAHPREPKESPALRFLRHPAGDLEEGGLLKTIVIPGAPAGAALERLAAPASAPSLLAVAVTVAFAGEKCTRARIALTGLRGRPARSLEAEAQVERTPADEEAIARAVEQLVAHAPFRADAAASAEYRGKIARVLALRALRRAIAQARRPAAAEARSRRLAPAQRAPKALPYFTSGRIELTVNGRPLRTEVSARTTLLELLRGEGLTAAKEGCGAGECGACSVLLDGRPVNACLTLALRAQGRAVLTAEGLAGGGRGLHRLQNAFTEAGAVLCGYCTPAALLQAKALLDAVPEPSEAEIKDALAGVLCPCNGGARAAAAVMRAAAPRSRP